ncbi:rhomboid family intramembrane serine protease [Pseudobdellovibrio sp. HCB154]|uniref:rhomboid family intramembrane serine protease n=1 Tax=Pseudobdellovibrio sp. HCB154 TaxID=3386277 RepID=UPI0039173CEA
MIFPGDIYHHKIQPSLTPVWVMIAVNVFVYLFTLIGFSDPGRNYRHEVYQEKVAKLSEMYRQTLDPVELETFDPSNVQVMIRDSRFWVRAQNFPFKGDQVKIEDTKLFLSELRSEYLKSPQYTFGLSPSPTSLWAWLTYQFLHTGFFHLAMNLFFLYLVLTVLQKHIPHTWVYSVYVLSGLGGGVAYLFMNQFNEIAVLGASGAICGLMAFLAVVANTRNIEWSYFLSPLNGYYGVIYLPAFLLFPVYLVSDFTTVLYYNTGIQASVAHSAHIGGTITGFTLGLYYLYDQRVKKHILKEWGHALSREDYSDLRDKVG